MDDVTCMELVVLGILGYTKPCMSLMYFILIDSPFFGDEYNFDIPRKFRFLSFYVYDRERSRKQDKVGHVLHYSN